MGAWYNGYSWTQREAILHAHRRLLKDGNLEPLAYLQSEPPCEMCRDPIAKQWHSEDYSPPFRFDPPATYALCAVCHSRLHKRFNEPAEWVLFLEHLRTGGYGHEFTKSYPIGQRRAWQGQLAAGQAIDLPTIRKRLIDGAEWWQKLTLDKRSIVAAWARPRPMRPRPARPVFEAAISAIQLRDSEQALLKYHAVQPNRSATMRQLARDVLSSASPSRANLVYGSVARRLAVALDWKPDIRNDGSPSWMTTVAEGWQPEEKGAEFEWVVVPSLASVFM